jgi:iron complex outermembrane recepter protein
VSSNALVGARKWSALARAQANESEYLPLLNGFQSPEGGEAVRCFLLLILACVVTPRVAASSAGSDTTVLPPIRVIEPSALIPTAARPTEFRGFLLEVDPVGETSLLRLIGRSPGMNVQNTGGESSENSVFMRGQEPHQSRLFLEGIPLTDAQFHQSHLAWFAPEGIESIDLFPEGTPASLAGDGLGGAMALSLVKPERVRSAFGARVGSFGSRRLYLQAVAQQPLPISLFGDFSTSLENFLYRDDRATPLFPEDDVMAPREHNGFSNVSLLPQATLWRSPHQRLDAFSFHAIRRNEIPGPSGMQLKGLLDSQYHLAALKGESIGKWANWSGNAYGWISSSNFSSAVELSAIQVRRLESYAVGTRLNAESALRGGRWEVTTGVTSDGSRIQSVNNRVVSVARTTLPLGLSGAWVFHPEWAFRPAVFGQAVIQNSEKNQVYIGLSPRFSVEWSPLKSMRWHALAGGFFRAPSMAEAFGSPSFISPNPDLRGEYALKAELGGDYAWTGPSPWLRKFELTTVVSVASALDLIVLQPNSVSSFIAQNVGASRWVSPELGMHWVFPRGWTLRSQASGMFTQNLSPAPSQWGKELPMRPRYRGSFELEFQRAGWKCTYAAQAIGPLFTDAANSRSVEAYWEHNVWGSWTSQSWGSFLIELRNIFDATSVMGSDWEISLFQNTTGLVGFPSPGRRVYFTWRYRL